MTAVPNSSRRSRRAIARRGLIHHPGNVATTYVLVAASPLVDGEVHLMADDSAHPEGTPASYRPQDRVLLACRDLIEPDDRPRAWTDASWRRAHRRGAAIALMEQIRARSVGRPHLPVSTRSSAVRVSVTRSRRGWCPPPSWPTC